MNNKGIEFRNINIIPNQIHQDLRKDQPVIRPIEKVSKATLWNAFKNNHKKSGTIAEMNSQEEDARLASEIMAEHLQDSPELESDWKYDKENNVLVIEIKNKITGQVLRQIPPEEILSGSFVPEKDANGNIINKIV